MEVKQINEESKGMFRAEEAGKMAGMMTYSWAGSDKFIIDHTEVEPAFSGKGVGKHMINAAVEFARAKNLKIIPLCPFAKASFLKDASLKDVLF